MFPRADGDGRDGSAPARSAARRGGDSGGRGAAGGGAPRRPGPDRPRRARRARESRGRRASAGRSGRACGPRPGRLRPGARPHRGGRVGHGRRGAGGQHPSGHAPRTDVRGVARRDPEAAGAPRLGRGAAPARHRRPRAGPDRPVAGRQLRAGPGGGAAHLALHRLPARHADRQRVRAADRGARRVLRHGRRRGHRGAGLRAGAAPAGAGQLPARRRRPDAHRPASPRHHPARRAQLRGRRQRGALAALVVPNRLRPLRGPRAAHRRLRGRRPGPPGAVPGVDLRDGGALRRSRPDARLEERLRRRRVGPRADGELAHRGLRLPRRDPLLRRGARQRARRALHDRERHLHARGGLRDPLEAPRSARRHQRGSAVSTARGQLHRHGRQLRVRLLLVLLSRRQHPARGEAHRHRLDDGHRAW